jgi:hypothetical protein
LGIACGVSFIAREDSDHGLSVVKRKLVVHGSSDNSNGEGFVGWRF